METNTLRILDRSPGWLAPLYPIIIWIAVALSIYDGYRLTLGRTAVNGRANAISAISSMRPTQPTSQIAETRPGPEDVGTDSHPLPGSAP